MISHDAGMLARLINDHLCEGVALVDPGGKIAWANPGFLRMCGYELGDLLGATPRDTARGAASAESRATLAAAIAAQAACTVDVSSGRRDGAACINEIRLAPVRNGDGALTYFVAVQRDVTLERSLAQESIDFKAYRRALDDQAIVSVTDPRGRITYVNSKFSKISGYASDELIGSTHRKVNSGTHDRSFFRDMWKAIRAGETWHGEVCNRSKSGELYWVDTTVVPVHGPGGEIIRYVSTRYEITERKAAETELRRMAEVDALTGLANRARFTSALTQKTAAALENRDGGGGLVLLFDLDHFKDLNDTLGHPCGDLLLQEIGRRLIASTGPDCLVARLGGDEFAALIPDAAIKTDARTFLDAIHGTACRQVALSDTIYLPSFSMGVTRYPDHAETLEGLLINADIALYEAKRNGRNQWCLFDPSVRGKFEYRSHLKDVLVDALENDRFEIAMQPIRCLRTGRHAGFEVLVRLMHAGKPVPPDHFIPLAEEIGLIVPIGRTVMRKGLAALKRMIDLGLAPGTVAINVAAPEFREIGFVEDVQDLLFSNALTPRDLIIEITETALIGRSTETVANALGKLKALGVRIALDDFGTGFSSLSHLREFSVDKIKIDKSFVQDLEIDEDDRALVDGLIALARRLGLDVVAEGVETEAQVEYLRKFGCRYLQGYIHSRPLTVEQAIAFLEVYPMRAPRPAAGSA